MGFKKSLLEEISLVEGVISVTLVQAEGIAGGTEPWLFLDAQSRKCTESWKAQCPVIEGSSLCATVKIWTSVCEQWETIKEFKARKRMVTFADLAIQLP